jgi:protein-tyrosine phosphatase
MPSAEAFVDIHCHLIPEIDDGAKSWLETFAMAEMAVADGIGTIVVTPHQLGTYSHNSGDLIRQRTAELQAELDAHEIPLEVLPGGDVRIEDDMVSGLRHGAVMSLADHRKHVLLELPHELYFPLDGILDELRRNDMVGILSHPERNQGLLREPALVESLVDAGCLMQVTASSLIGGMGGAPQEMAEWMLANGLVHFLATDAHGPKSRRPLMTRAFERVVELSDWEVAVDLCCRNPRAVAEGNGIAAGRRATYVKKRGSFASWFSWRKAG